MRKLFADGINSFWHVLFGILGVYWWGVIPGFIIYQYLDITEKNVRVDLGEFFIGFLVALACMQIGILPEGKTRFSFTGF